MLYIRNFVKGQDEEVWIKIVNEAFKEREDFRPLTKDDMVRWEESPYFDADGLFVAEFNGIPIGCVEAFIDKKRKDRVGIIRELCVVPKFRGRGIGRELLKRAVDRLRQNGMEFVQAYIWEDMVAAKALFESMGFGIIRTTSKMAMDLSQIPNNIGENTEVGMKEITESEEDVETFMRLFNEVFEGHFGFRPITLEEARFWKRTLETEVRGAYFACLGDEHVGFVVTYIDKAYNECRGRKRGLVASIGVLKPHRRKGIGTALLLHSLRFLKSHGMEEAVLTVDDLNPTNAIELYRKVGFKVMRKYLTYQKSLSDEPSGS